MTQENQFYLSRKFIKEGDVDEACHHYYLVKKEDPNNTEAEFFSAYLGYTVLIKTNSASAVNAFKAMIACLAAAVKYVKESEGNEDEKLLVISAMVEAYTPITRFLFTSHIDTSSSSIEGGTIGLYDLGSAIKKEFGSNPKFMEFAIKPWKEAVSLQRKFYAYKYNGINPEDYAAEIKKVDPAYTMPDKAGCISLA